MRTVHSLSAETALPALSHVPKLASLTLDLCVLPNLFPHTYDQPMSAFCICINQTQCRFMGLDELAFKPPTDGGWHSNDRESWIRQIQALTSSPPSGHADGARAPPSSPSSTASTASLGGHNAAPWARMANRLTTNRTQRIVRSEPPSSPPSSPSPRAHVGNASSSPTQQQHQTQQVRITRLRSAQRADNNQGYSEQYRQQQQQLLHPLRQQPRSARRSDSNIGGALEEHAQPSRARSTAHTRNATDGDNPQQQHNDAGQLQSVGQMVDFGNEQCETEIATPGPPSADTSGPVGQRASSVDGTEEQVTLQQLQCQLEQVKERAEALEKRIICQICCERSRNAVVMPCLHFYYCDECIDQHFARCDIAKCPLCRTPVQGVLQLRQGQ